jgi:hypothetical protein
VGHRLQAILVSGSKNPDLLAELEKLVVHVKEPGNEEDAAIRGKAPWYFQQVQASNLLGLGAAKLHLTHDYQVDLEMTRRILYENDRYVEWLLSHCV